MTKLEKLQKEYPMLELTVKPAPEYLKEIYIAAGCNEPKKVLFLSYKGPSSEDIDDYSEIVGNYDWEISVLRDKISVLQDNLDKWVSKIYGD